MQFRIVSDSACDLTQEQIARWQVEIVPFYVSFTEGEYFKEREEISVEHCYQKMVTQPDVFPKTAMPTPEDYLQKFRNILSQGLDVLCFSITATLSGSVQAAHLARTEALEEFPDRQIVVVDSFCATVEQGLLILEAAKAAEAGCSVTEAAQWVEDAKRQAHIYFTIGDLKYLQKGGRIGKAIKLAAIALKVKPLLHLFDGELHPIGIARSRKKALSSVLSEFEKSFADGKQNIHDFVFVVGHGHDKAEGEAFRVQVQEVLASLGYQQPVDLCEIGITIGVHTGPHPIGIGFVPRWKNPQ